MPPELLRDVLMRIERSEDTWPSRKNVVSCVGVCKNWRQIFKEIVNVPEVSSKFTFPISLKQPGPGGSLVQCYVKRNRSNQTFYLYLGGEAKIFCQSEPSEPNKSIWKLSLKPGGTATTQTELDNFVSFRSPSGQKEGVLVLKSKVPRLEEQSWCLDFNGWRDIVSSGKKFQLVALLRTNLRMKTTFSSLRKSETCTNSSYEAEWIPLVRTSVFAVIARVCRDKKHTPSYELKLALYFAKNSAILKKFVLRGYTREEDLLALPVAN
ncbi:Contains similarity to 'tub' protein F22K20.1 gi/2829918 homolog from A. thaliana BAC gb/AC002291 [Arabidopsis thaliana]|uniref:Putative Tubby-like protein 4 n=1 Tax=Arabidopsis thaliana TaxID=3702 RepID=TLP4_ARATH|nr:tubby like protein 4 [Arabidopsis thaliana]O80699.1 RecName: Full=Putative Tubby-like protein 4; Short=AtTLP4 [Arabidopsis thaliana]AAC28518.1 Contains similarity to 'tub' protein F22K20.1 gi/2829918 homolog from A. thaliana BAC gb/AC002291 [Arabidopsis thaliana]ANM58625.1 tubby like protein 4 [Arabidopsis thaliana]|eukprot:NP_001321047.1 tubby like protein 4 [Arabidopsis thaliana]